MSSYARLLVPILTLLLFCQPLFASEEASRPDGVRAFLQQGEYSLAIKAAHALLSEPELPEQDRYELLFILAEAEENLTEIGQYVDVTTALRAYEDLNKEFPERFAPEKLQWKIASLNWKHGDFNRADTAAQIILNKHSQTPEAKKAALLHARQLISEKMFQQARSVLLIQFGFNPNTSALEETEGLIWLAVIDEAENSTRKAYKSLQKAYVKHPALIENSAMVYATYIRLLALYSDHETLLSHLDGFIKLHITSPEAPIIRLLQADTLAAQGLPKDAETIYGILADRYNGSAIGTKAFMRKLMLKLKDSQDMVKLGQAISTLSNLAAANQLSEIEAEAQLYQAQLLVRLSHTDAKHLDHAIAYYALVATSDHANFVTPARKDGSNLLNNRLHELLEQEQWLQAILLWKRYPQLRPAKAKKLSFGIAQAYSHLMDYAHAEAILSDLYKQAKGTVWGHRVMLEMAHLWTDREDADSVVKIMRWLTSHEHTLYRQDMLLIVATAQTKRGETSAARQTLASVVPQDLTPELRFTYWLTQAKNNLALQRWHTAADAWRQLAVLSQESEKWHFVYAQADATIQGADYLNAEKILLQIPEAERNGAWHYALALCATNSGRWKTAEEHLIPLSMGDPADNYTMRARILLAEKRSEKFLRQQQ